jgi:hypothetical protein
MGVTRVLQACYKSDNKGVARALQGQVTVVYVCYKGDVTRLLQGCNKSVTRVLQRCNNAYRSFLASLLARMFKEYYKSVTRV